MLERERQERYDTHRAEKRAAQEEAWRKEEVRLAEMNSVRRVFSKHPGMIALIAVVIGVVGFGVFLSRSNPLPADASAPSQSVEISEADSLVGTTCVGSWQDPPYETALTIVFKDDVTGIAYIGDDQSAWFTWSAFQSTGDSSSASRRRIVWPLGTNNRFILESEGPNDDILSATWTLGKNSNVFALHRQST